MRDMTRSWRERAAALRREVFALMLATRDPRTPWAARIVAVCVVAYAFSPIDLIPDFVPVLGYVDDLLLLPLGAMLALRLIPPEVMADCRARADETLAESKPTNWVAAGLIIALWITLAAGGVLVGLRLLHR
jgi:uncharacterized membrane protein YkvA (DUF1232 family)